MNRFLSPRFFLVLCLIILLIGCVEEEKAKSPTITENTGGKKPSCCCEMPSAGDFLTLYDNIGGEKTISDTVEKTLTQIEQDDTVDEGKKAQFVGENAEKIKKNLVSHISKIAKKCQNGNCSLAAEEKEALKMADVDMGVFLTHYRKILENSELTEPCRNHLLKELDAVHIQEPKAESD